MVTVREDWLSEVFYPTRVVGAPLPEETGLPFTVPSPTLSQGQYGELLASWPVLDTAKLCQPTEPPSRPVP